MNRYRTSSLVALGMVVGMVGGLVVAGLAGAVFGAFGVGFASSGGAAPVDSSSPSPPAATAEAVPIVSAPAVDVLRGWDLSRAHAYAHGDAEALRSLYVAGSVAGTTDVRLLRSYAGRGLRVEGMKMQILAVDVLAHSQSRWRIRVTDRLFRAVAVGNGARVVLPRDQASTRVVAMLLRAGAWRVASVG